MVWLVHRQKEIMHAPIEKYVEISMRSRRCDSRAIKMLMLISRNRNEHYARTCHKYAHQFRMIIRHTIARVIRSAMGSVCCFVHNWTWFTTTWHATEAPASTHLHKNHHEHKWQRWPKNVCNHHNETVLCVPREQGERKKNHDQAIKKWNSNPFLGANVMRTNQTGL